MFAEDPAVLGRLRQVVLRLPDGREREAELVSVRPGARGLPVVRLARCRHRDEAEELLGALLLVSREELGPLDPEEFYLADAVGCVAQTPSGEALGTVVGVGDNGAQPLLLIRGAARVHNVPAVPQFIVDFDGERLVLDLPEGLWDVVGHPVGDG